MQINSREKKLPLQKIDIIRKFYNAIKGEGAIPVKISPLQSEKVVTKMIYVIVDISMLMC